LKIRISSLTATQKGLVKDREVVQTPSPVFRRSSAPDMRKNRLSVSSSAYADLKAQQKEEEDEDEEVEKLENPRSLRVKSMVTSTCHSLI
jgi:hypothetical protein